MRSFKEEGVGALRVKTYSQLLSLKQGIDQDMSRKIVKLIKESKCKVQAAVQGDEVTGVLVKNVMIYKKLLRLSESGRFRSAFPVSELSRLI